MRNKFLSLPLLLCLLGAATVQTVALSPDCDKWLREYKQHLAETPAVKKVRGHVHHLLHPVKPQLVQAKLPQPAHKPRLTPTEMVRRFHVLCGDLPPNNQMALLSPDPTPLAPAGRPFVANTEGAPIAPLVDTPAGDTPSPSSPFSPPGSPIPGIPGGGGPSGGGSGGPGTPSIPPVPEPSSIFLLLTGIAGVEVVRRRGAKLRVSKQG